jgi:hypothetical protein
MLLPTSTSLPGTYVLGRLACFGALLGAFVLDVADRDPQLLRHRSWWGKWPRFNDLPLLIVQRLAGIGGVEDLADIRRELQEQDEAFPGLPLDPDRGRMQPGRATHDAGETGT